MNVLVTGAAGQLGAVIVRRFRAAGHTVVATTRHEVDITRDADVRRATEAAAADVLVNCAAYNDVDGAEDDAAAALEVNAFAVRALARAAREAGAVLVHYGTDFVFDGETDRAYTEDDLPRPASVYAGSKFLGECFARDAERYYVLRVESLFGGPAARSSIDRIIEALGSGREARVFVDRVVTPSYVEDVAQATERLLVRGPAYGLYHCVNSGETTWYDLGRHVARLAGADERLLVPTPVAAVSLRARRPRFAALANGKLAAAGAPMPTWQDALERYFALQASRVPRS